MPLLHPTQARASSGLKLATLFALLVATVFLGVWCWSKVCQFPSIPWNDLRLAPSIALAQGLSPYATDHDGVVTTWFYGPLPILFYWPASWGTSAASASLIAAGINLALTLVPLALVCFAWPGEMRDRAGWLRRSAAFLLCLALWAERHYAVIFADNLAIACGLTANLALVRARSSKGRWLAAILATAALACKQVTVGIVVAQLLWLASTLGWREAARHAARCALTGVILALLAMAIFGREELWFTLITLPKNFGWEPSLWNKFSLVLPELGWQVGVPAAAMLFCTRAFRRQPDLRLAMLTWACALPLGIAAIFKAGGWLNSLHCLPLWLPPVLTVWLTTRQTARNQWALPLAAAIAAAALACSRLVLAPTLPLRPEIASYQEAAQLAKQWPNQIWFPFHPLVTLYSDHHYYHDEDGFFIREVARQRITSAQAAAYLPSAMHLIAFHNDWSDRGFARRMMPPNTRSIPYGHWTVLSGYSARVPP